jgi:tRNA(Phe) wybutosine-synthesizing methylase Tyw3
MYGFIMSYKISDEVAMRFIQIFQEAILLGIDGADLMRQVRLVIDTSEQDNLVLDSDYKQFVEKTHQQYLKELEEKMSATQLNLDMKNFQ